MDRNAIDYAGSLSPRPRQIPWGPTSLAVWVASVVTVLLSALTFNPWPLLALVPFNPIVGTALGVIALLDPRRTDPEPIHADNLARIAVCLNLTTLVLAITILVLGHVGPW